MTNVDKVRRIAWSVRKDLGLSVDDCIAAEDLLCRLEKHTGILRQYVSMDDPILAGAQAVLDAALYAIYQQAEQPERIKCFNAAHEFGHWYLHHRNGDRQNCRCSSDDLSLDLEGGESIPIAKVVGYSARERRESEANVFASELLLPLPAALRAFEMDKSSAKTLADLIGIEDSVARRQLTDAVLLPVPAEHLNKQSIPNEDLDESQRAAARVTFGPLLVSAGPGTGKTKTLVGRCLYLTKDQKVRPQSILALTYSRKAAGEMQDRLQASGVGSENSGPWIGTFHSFGLEILRKYGDQIDLNPQFHLIDQLDAVTLLENNIDALKLVSLTTIKDPSRYLRGILDKIQRAKDELVGPAEFELLADKMSTAAEQQAAVLKSSSKKLFKKDRQQIDRLLQDIRRIKEVSHCYYVYDRLLKENDLVDYADLIFRSVGLLLLCPDVRRAVHRQYPHVLADEYQDVNRASARLLKLLAGEDASGLWVVGDHRQSIFQFQGASPANVSKFLSDYPNGRLHDLQVNYRSVEQIVSTFGLASKNLSFSNSGLTNTQWTAYRGRASNQNVASMLLTVKRRSEQYQCIKDKILAFESDGFALSQQAILCRTHNQAKEIASSLNQSGVPVLYLGRLLDRPEIKDLISIISACATNDSAAFVRAAQLPEYGLSVEEAILASRDRFANNEGNGKCISALKIGQSATDGINKLVEQLTELRNFVDRPSLLIRNYIFEYSTFLNDISSQEKGLFDCLQCKLAIREFLDIVDGYNSRVVLPAGQEEFSGSVKLLHYLRKNAVIGTSAPLPEGESITALKAVRVMTLHSSKGLEFPVVFMPNMNAGYFPSKAIHDGVPDLQGMTADDTGLADEEDCLFFVGLSRARDLLLLTTFLEKDNGAPAAPSRFLESLNDAISTGVMKALSGVEYESAESLSLAETLLSPNGGSSQLHTLSELDQYLRCPRLYYYSRIARLTGTATDEGYLKFHNIISRLADWIEHESAANNIVPLEERRRKLDDLWRESGPIGHKHEQYFRSQAETIANIEPANWQLASNPPILAARLRNGTVQIRPDAVRIDDGVMTVIRRRIGPVGDTDHTDKRLALMRRAVLDSYPEMTPVVRLHYLADGTTVDVDENPRYEPGRIAKYEDAIDGILSRAFPPEPQSSETCLSCQFLFVCPRRDITSEPT